MRRIATIPAAVGRLRELDFTCLSVALVLALVACLPLRYPLRQDTFVHMAIVDITRSMNVQDYRLQGRPLSRLEFVKFSLRRALTLLPCGSRLGLGVFTERRAFVLFEPIEVCSGFSALDAAIEQIDWRMAWEADSRIADGLYHTLDLLKDHDANVIFITDGHEAPPANPRYRPPLESFKGKAGGMIVGVGGLNPSPIPKFNERGEAAGFYSEDEVPQRSTFGLPEMAPEETEGYHARNAPFGTRSVAGTEHLSSLKEDYLRQLGAESGLSYRRLESPASFVQAVLDPQLARQELIRMDVRWIPASLALLALAAVYVVEPLRLRGR